MPKTSGPILDGITWCCQPYTVILCLIACKKEAPRSKGDTGEVSAKGTPMLKSVSDTDKQVEKQSFDKKNNL